MINRKDIIKALDLKENPYHPLVFILGEPEIGENTYIGLFSEINANHVKVKIGKNCDIASFVSINGADSHKLTVGLKSEIERGDITIGDNVFIGSHSFIGRNTHIGAHSVVGAGTVLINAGVIPPYSLITGNPCKIKERYYEKYSS